MSVRQIFADDKGNVLFGRSEGDLEIFVDGAWGVSSSGPMVKVNFYTCGINSDGKTTIPGERREVAFRLVTSITRFISIAKFLADQAKNLEEQLSPPPEVQELLAQLTKEQKKSGPDRKKFSKRKKISSTK